MSYKRSPIFYMGNKLELLPNLIQHFPDKDSVSVFVDVFGGSGVVSANVDYDYILYNELNPNIFNLFKLVSSTSPEEIRSHILNRICEYNLIKAGKEEYINFRTFYNESDKDIKDLYTLTFYSFSNLIRFNQSDGFNMPVGNQHYIEERHHKILEEFYELFKDKTLVTENRDAFELFEVLKSIRNEFDKPIYLYLDPPYSNTTAVYNGSRAYGGWTIEHDLKLFAALDEFTELGIPWSLSNVLEHKGQENTHLKDWVESRGYNMIHFTDKQYVSLGKGNANTKEVLIKNYK